MDHESVIRTAIQAARSGQRVVLMTTPRNRLQVQLRITAAAQRTSMVDGTAYFTGGGWVRLFTDRLHAAGADCDVRLALES